jgi:hypothetical protein
MGKTETASRISLDQSAFEQSVARYLDEYKPDPLVKRQLEGWSLEWTDGCPVETQELLDFSPTHVVSGSLRIRGGYDFLSVTLQMACWWSEDKLFFRVCASAAFDDDNTKENSKTARQLKLRLQKDDYVSKLTTLQPVEVCVARIHQSPNDLEERVDCQEDIGEGIRRAVFSAADSALDVFEILLNFPSLPVNKLASRAKLRLLEDAMCNACEQEGEDELVSDLELKNGEEDDDDDDDDVKRQHKRSRKKV